MDPATWIGARLGAYEIVSLIGAGGMGEVYRARRIDAQYEKEVAIKVVSSGLPAAFVLKRLRAERQILAQLDHPNIAQLIDGGATESGHPYLVMGLVEGVPLDRYCEEHQLSIDARLRLFRDVCSAVSHAHQHLIVHRDLKPANILVTADGVVKLLDFGIAKLLQGDVEPDRARRTVTRLTTATLDFASPEQALGKTVTTASDVYSLGVILYLLLARRMPYLTQPISQHEAIREICEVEPPRPSLAVEPGAHRSIGKITADLDAIALRALRKEPEKRYRSVDELSDDVGRYLSALPVIARDGQFAYRAAKFVRRRRFAIAAAGVIALSLAGGIVASVHQARVADAQRARAERHASTVRAFAELSLFQLHDAIKDLPGSTAARELLVRTAQQYLNALQREAERDRGLQRDIAVAYAKIADIQGKAYNANEGQPKEALASYTKAIALLEPLTTADPRDPVTRMALAQSYLQQSRLIALLGDTRKAVAGSHRASDMFASLAAADASLPTRSAYADALRVHAVNLQSDGNIAEALRYAEKSAGIFEELHARYAADTELAFQVGMAYSTASDLLGSGKPTAEARQRALDLQLKALQVDEQIVQQTDGHNATYVRSLAGDRLQLCRELIQSREFVRAVDQCRAAQPLLDGLRGRDDKNEQLKVDRAIVAWNLAVALIGAKRWNEASTILESNLRELTEIARDNDTIQVEYVRASSEEAFGEVQSAHALNAAPGSARQTQSWRSANEWFAKSVSRFQQVSKGITLEYPDRLPMDGANAGLERSRAELARLRRGAKNIGRGSLERGTAGRRH